MTPRAFRPRCRNTAFMWQISCRAGVLSFGAHADFLLTLLIAKQQKARWIRILPFSTLRAHLLYPNGQRVSRHDLKAALAALADPVIGASISARLASPAGVPPAAHSARTARTAGESGDLQAAPPLFFRQAGVVAPPDSLTGETSMVPEFVEMSA